MFRLSLNICRFRGALAMRRPFMSSFKKPPSTSFEDPTPVANSDSQNHSANPSNQGSSFASIGNLQSMNSIEDSLPGFFNQHHSENHSNRGSSSASIGDLQSLNSIDNSLPESFDQVEGDQECSVEIDKKHLKWNNQMDVVLIDSLLDQMLKGQKIGGSFTSSAYRAASNAVSTKFSVHCDSSHVRNRLKTLKRNLAMAKDMLTTDSGFGYNHSTQLIEATTGVWAAYLKAKPKASQFQHAPIQNFQKLYDQTVEVSCSSNSKKRENKLGDTLSKEIRSIKEGLDAVAAALDRGNLQNYTNGQLFEEIEKVSGMSGASRMKVYQVLAKEVSDA
ncbi:uncharacterized protein LOC114302342 [Camellia sinensis]|uniref:uncharacterized protein LOC114302342 n=1 Tax=Camellia sinensis TaxID=4442 RepID=UPI001035C013|nr:uncharacterized protein LOC114302342 [Camellia sinensis]